MFIKFENLTPSDKDHIRSVLRYKNHSVSEKRKVAAIIGIPNEDNTKGISLTSGINHIFREIGNKCEDENGETIPYVVHAEEDAIFKYLKSTVINAELLLENKVRSDVTIYVTYSPCQNCCKQIVLSGIKRVVFVEKHASNFCSVPFAPKDFLESMNIKYIQTTEPINL